MGLTATEIYDLGSNWLNENEGILALVLFLVSAAFAWFSGIISALRRRPKLKMSSLPGPTLCTVFDTGRQHESHPTHRVAISLYLHVANAGSAPTSIGNIRVGYAWTCAPLSRLWWSRLWKIHWIENQAISLRDFQVDIGASGDIKIYPFLTQKSVISGTSANNYLDIGEMTNGVTYFEQSDAWGACQPAQKRGLVSLHVEITDAFGGRHRARFKVPTVSIAEAKKFNPSFGDSLESLRDNDVLEKT